MKRAIQSERTSEDAKFNDTSRNSWKLLFEVSLARIILKQIDLLALDFYDVLLDEARSFLTNQSAYLLGLFSKMLCKLNALLYTAKITRNTEKIYLSSPKSVK